MDKTQKKREDQNFIYLYALGGQKAGHELYRFVTLPRLCWYLLPLQRKRQD